jgi:hypothetical protein
MIWVSEGTIIVSVPYELGRVVLADKRGIGAEQELTDDENKLFCIDKSTLYGLTGTARVHDDTGLIKLDVQVVVAEVLNNPGVQATLGEPTGVADRLLEGFYEALCKARLPTAFWFPPGEGAEHKVFSVVLLRRNDSSRLTATTIDVFVRREAPYVRHEVTVVLHPWANGSFPAVFGDCDLYNELVHGTNPLLNDLLADENLMKFVLGAVVPEKIPFQTALDFGARLVYLTSTRGSKGEPNSGVGTIVDVGILRSAGDAEIVRLAMPTQPEAIVPASPKD